jgi:hypothetical protein
MKTTLKNEGYSARVSLALRVQGETFDVAKVGPSRLVLREARRLPSGSAQLIVTVGDKTTEQEIVLSPNGTTADVSYCS